MDNFSCYICFESLNEPVLCPKCSKLGCKSCLTEWLQQNRQCPHCRKRIHPNQLLPCRWIKEIEDEFSQTKIKLVDLQLSLELQQIDLKAEASNSQGIQIVQDRNLQLVETLKEKDYEISLLKNNLHKANTELDGVKWTLFLNEREGNADIRSLRERNLRFEEEVRRNNAEIAQLRAELDAANENQAKLQFNVRKLNEALRRRHQEVLDLKAELDECRDDYYY